MPNNEIKVRVSKGAMLGHNVRFTGDVIRTADMSIRIEEHRRISHRDKIPDDMIEDTIKNILTEIEMELKMQMHGE